MHIASIWEDYKMGKNPQETENKDLKFSFVTDCLPLD